MLFENIDTVIDIVINWWCYLRQITSDQFAQIRVQVDSTGQELFQVTDVEDSSGRFTGQERFQLTRAAVNLQ